VCDIYFGGVRPCLGGLLAVDILSVIRSGAAGAMPPLATFTAALLACWQSIYSELFAAG